MYIFLGLYDMMVARLGRIRRCLCGSHNAASYCYICRALWIKSGRVCSAAGICDVGLAKSPSGGCPGGEPCWKIHSKRAKSIVVRGGSYGGTTLLAQRIFRKAFLTISGDFQL